MSPNEDNVEFERVMKVVNEGRVPLTERDDVIIPPVLYLPVRVSVDGRQLAEVRAIENGRSALLAYTALDRLIAQCGREQPWSLVNTDMLGEIKADQPFDVVAFDPLIGARLKRDGMLI